MSRSYLFATRDEYANGYSLYAFDLTADQNSVRTNLKFSRALDTTMTFIIARHQFCTTAAAAAGASAPLSRRVLCFQGVIVSCSTTQP